MSEPLALTEAMIHDLADPEVFARGRSYLRQGAVTGLARSEDRISAQVYGSAAEPYRVRVKFGPAGVTEADCTCPYDWGGACKHVVAVLLACVEDPEAVVEVPSLEARLARLSAEELRALLLGLAKEDDEIARRIERRALARETAARPASVAAAPLDPTPYQRRARALIRAARGGRYDDYSNSGDDVRYGLLELLEPVAALLHAGDGRNALVLLEAVTEEFVGAVDQLYDDEGELGSLVERLNEWWTEALLSADLAPEERQAWARKLRKWDKKLAASENIYDVGLETAAAAAEQGWDYPPLIRVLQGEITERGAWEGEAPDYADELAVARLNILERQGRLQEYLYLAEAESQTERLLAMLARIGRVDEAVEKGREWLTQPQQILALAKALHEHGHAEPALQLAEHGLALAPPSGVRGGWVEAVPAVDEEDDVEDGEAAGELDELDEAEEVDAAAAGAFRLVVPMGDAFGWSYHRADLARWLRDSAAALGHAERALAAARIAVDERPSLADYQALLAAAGEQWPELRAAALERLRAPNYATRDAAVEIFLHERLVDDAIAALESGHQGHEIVGRVVAAVQEQRPEWAMNACFHQAARIIEPGRAQYYDAAAEWLARAREVAAASGLLPEWKRRMDEIITHHQRKYKLMPLLKALRSSPYPPTSAESSSR